MTAGSSFRVLGSLEYHRDGQRVEISAPKLRIVLASLVLRPGQTVPFETLVERLWDTDPPDGARAALQSTLTRLRRLLGRDGQIQVRGSGYALDLPPRSCDVEDFATLTTAAQAAVEAGDRIAGLDALRRATALWRGPILSDVESAALHRDEVPRLVERCLEATEQRFELELATGNHRGIVEELRHLAAAHPLREGLRAHLMRALYRSGRQAEALDVYRETRALLQSELGVDPGPELRAVQQTVLLGQDEPQPSPITISPALCQLPPPMTHFVGRAEDIRTLEAWLSHVASVPVAVVTGVPGVGKSTLAAYVAHRLRPRFPDGQLYVNLEGAGPTPRDPAEVLGELLLALGHTPSALPQSLGARAAAFRARIADHKYFVLLDDAASADQVLPLMPGTPGSAMLVTSRRSLPELSGAQELRLQPLSPGEGMALLGQAVDAARMSEEPDVAQEIVDLCGRLPLALRIIGARLQPQRSMRLSVLADRLRDDRRRLDELAVGRLEVRSGLDVSYTGLPEPVQVALRRMALLPSGSFAAWALGAICDGTDGERLAEQLTTAGLLEAVGTDRSGRSRFRPHDLVAVYATELSEGEPEEQQRPGVERLLDTLLDLGFEAYPRMTRVNEGLPPDELPTDRRRTADLGSVLEDADGWVDSERALLLHTIALACRFGLYAKAAVLADLVVPALAIRGSFDPLQQARALVRDAALAAGDERVAARAQTSRADILLSERIDAAAEAFEFCLPIFRRLGHPRELVHSLTGLAFARSWQGLPGTAHAEEATRIASEADDRNMLMLALRSHGEALLLADEPARALALFQEALVIALDLDHAEAQRMILIRITDCTTTLGDLDAAETVYQQAYELTDTRTNSLGLAWLLMHHSRIRRARGDHRAAIAEARRAHELMERAGDVRGMATVSTHLAETMLEAGDVAAAVTLLDETLAALETNDVPRLRERAQALRTKALTAGGSTRPTTKSVAFAPTRS